MTPAALKSAVLKKLQITAAGDTDAADDIAIMTQKYTGMHQMLLVAGLVIWSKTENVPGEAELPIVAMLAAAAASDFGIPEPRHSRLQLEGAFNLPVTLGGPSLAERQLRKALAPKHISSTVVSEYF